MDKKGKLWEYMSPEMKDLILDAEYLVKEAKEAERVLTDYSYLVFQVAKVYEGFLKKLMVDLGILTEEQVEREHFRIGKALNPFIDSHLKNESYFEKLADEIGTDMAMELWEQWKRARNLLFHYFPNHLQCIRLSEAEKIIEEVIETMAKALEKINNF